MYRILVNAKTYADGSLRGTPGWSRPGTALDRVAKLKRNGWRR